MTQQYLQYISRYGYTLNNEQKRLDDLGWNINLKIGKDHVVHFCKRCKGQHSFVITEEHLVTSKTTGKQYVAGYYGYCVNCMEK